MSEWNYTKCAKPFTSVDEAREYMMSRGFEGSNPRPSQRGLHRSVSDLSGGFLS